VVSIAINTIVGVVANHHHAQLAAIDLKLAGFDEDQIGIRSRIDEGHVLFDEVDGDTEAGTGAAAGAAAGAGLGALWGLGILAGVLLGIGPAIVGGTLGMLLSSAAAGATAVGIAGTLVGLGLSEEDATYYEDEFKSGLTPGDSQGRSRVPRGTSNH
jgi:hypothetical protein